MSLRRPFETLKGRLEQKARRAFGSRGNPTQPASSIPNVQTAPQTTNPVPQSPTTPAAGSSPTGLNQSWAHLKGLIQVLDKGSGVSGPLKTVMDDLARCINIYEDAVAVRKDYQALKSQLEALFNELSTHFSGNVPPSMTASMENLCTAIERELDSISTKEGRGAGRRLIEARKDLDDVVACYRRIHTHLERLRLNADLSTWKSVEELATEHRLKSLTPSMSAAYNSAQAAIVRRRECTPKTREQVLSELSHWRHDRDQGNMYWLNGMAGTGKTTIANSLCAMLDRAHELGASFFCTRQLPECRDVKFILPTIAYQLARFSRPFHWALSRALEQDPDVHTRALPNQLEGLIIGPLREVAHALPTHLVVVIDALDECEDTNGVGQVLEMLANHASKLPIKVFVSSRPEPQIRDKIGGTKAQLVLHELDKSVVKGDIETYLRAELARMSLSDAQLAALVERAGVLFIYAATVVRYVGEDDFSLNPKKRLENVLGSSVLRSSNKNKDIDDLYSLILASALDNPKLDDLDKDQLRLVLHTVICAREPLTVDAIAGLLQLDNVDEVHSSLRRLWSVLHIAEANKLVTTLHASFPDYMFDSSRSKRYSCDSEAHHGILAELCFGRIKRNKVQFNICGLESSYLFDEQVAKLDERVNQAIPLDLIYACQYWAVHLQLGGQSGGRMQLLVEFLSMRLLLWMEVLNLKKRMNVGALLLEKARGWCMEGDSTQEQLKSLVYDAWRFVTMFAANPISRSTPHIYVSMLAFWPLSRSLADCYIPRTRGLAEVGGTGITRRQLALLSVFATTDSVINSVAFSPDGMRIASGSNEGKICVWDAQDGHMTLGPLEPGGHIGMVHSVAFSPDGTQILSGALDSKIRLWNARNGQMVLGPLEGHSGPVNSVAFSPDGMRIASGSLDETLCVWDAHNGQMVLGPLEGHTNSVTSVAFSPNSMRIVSGSDDGSVRVWDARDGKIVLGPLQEHTDPRPVSTVAFSPDNMRIASGSYDFQVHVWDARSGQEVLGPLEGHAGPVTSVTFSLDGIHIASGSLDKTICVWDAQNGQMVLGPLEGHANWVTSIAFSPDGMRIISGSSDNTIRMWDARGEQMMPVPLEGHTDSVNSVTFSPDGKRIVSGSSDSTMFVWDAQSGQMVLGPLKGNEDFFFITSTAFSPDSTRIVSGFLDSVICVWDAHDGHMVLGPLKGHTNAVQSVAFSPNGTRIASGSSDSTICVWDAQSGEMVLGPLEGHTEMVHMVAFSPDGMRIVSSSSDSIIRVWDAQSGQLVLKPLEGHTTGISSIALSPDGLRIVSGAFDSMIVWDVLNGQVVLKVFEEQTNLVRSVAFSPDGMRIVSGFEDGTICVWDAQSGQVSLGPLKGHLGPVLSTAFSRDGTRVISGSEDKVIRVWNVQNQQSAANPPSSPNASSSPFVHDHPAVPKSLLKNSSSGVASASVLDEHGWIVGEHRRLCLWVPPDLRACLLLPRNPFLMSTRGSVRVSFDGSNIGESWIECYSPA